MDLRLPIGIIFTIYGLLLTGYGFFTKDDKAMYAKSLDHNVNITWGAVLLVFGVIMWVMAKRGSSTPE